MKKYIALFLLLLFALTLVSCGENKISGKEAKEQVNTLLDYVKAENFENAQTLVHPNRPIDFKSYFNGKEIEYNVDFQSGIEIKRYTGFSSALYDSEVDGGKYELDMDILVSGRELELSVELVRNDRGYGIYDIDIDD